MADLIYPTVDLFLYDLRDGLGQSNPEITKNRDLFIQKFAAIDDNDENKRRINDNDDQFEAEFVELLGESKLIEKFKCKAKPCEGYYYPVRLSDTYGLLLDCSVQDKTSLFPVYWIADIKKIIEEKLKSQVATLGQTWMIYGQLPSDSTQSHESVAEECFKALMPNGNWKQDLKGQGYFLGGTIFELWRHRLVLVDKNTPPLPEVSPQLPKPENYHVIIVIYPDEPSASKSGDFLDDWMRLFCYRNKILFAYSQSRKLKQSLKADFQNIQNYIALFKNNNSQGADLKKLQQDLNEAEGTFSTYTIDLSYFEYQIRTLEINLYNYEQRLDTLREHLQSVSLKSDIKFLESFSRDCKNKYQLQMQKDYENLSPGWRLLEVFLNFVRARVEVDQAQSDRSFQETLEAAGVGFAVAAIAATAISPFMEKITQPLAKQDSKPSPTPQPTVARSNPAPPPPTTGLLSPELLPWFNLVMTVMVSVILGMLSRCWASWWVRSRSFCKR
jgi:hypothetical protein